MRNKNLIWITQTALLIALIVLSQLLTYVLPSITIGISLRQLVTGTLVNLVLIFGAYLAGMAAAGTAGLISPILAAFFGIIPGHLPQMVPVVMAGNLVLVFIIWLCFRASNGLSKRSSFVLTIIGIVVGAILKSLTMWSATSRIIIPFLLLKGNAASLLLVSVSIPQFITAVIGGALAIMIIPAMKPFKKGKK